MGKIDKTSVVKLLCGGNEIVHNGLIMNRHASNGARM